VSNSQNSGENARGNPKYFYSLTERGLCSCAFLDVDKKTLALTEYFDEEMGELVSRREREYWYARERGDIEPAYVDIDTGKKHRPKKNDPDPNPLPLHLDMQLHYLEMGLMNSYLKTRWGKEFQKWNDRKQVEIEQEHILYSRFLKEVELGKRLLFKE
jgi:hypothetical protein